MSEDSPFNRGSRLDRAIDRAVHEMVHRDPPAGLRRRVLAEIERPALVGRVPRLALSAVALAALAILALYLRPQPAPPAPRAESVTARAPLAPPAVAPAMPKATSRAETPVTRSGRPRATDTLIPMPRVRNVFATRAHQAAGASMETWQMTALSDAALATDAAPVGERMGALNPPALRTTAITIPPLDIEQFQILPLRK